MIADEIKSFFCGDVLTDEETLKKYSRDYSIFAIKPEAVVFPKNAEDVKKLVKFAKEKKRGGEKISLTARSAGSDMTGGPLNDSIIVEFSKYFNRIEETGADYALVQPGVYFRDFEKELKNCDLFFPPYPASKLICAIGGMLANNSGGEKTLAYGKTEDYVLELKAVLSDGEEHVIRPLNKLELQKKLEEESFEGEIYRRLHKLIEENYDLIKAARPDVSKNSAGYYLWNVWDKNTFDLTKLFVGSQGTLGLITEAKLRLVHAKKYSRLAAVFLKDLHPLAALIVAALKFKPESLESYDDKTLWLALRFLPGLIKAMKGNALILGFQFIPELWMLIRGGVPKMVVLAEFTSDDEEELQKRLAAFKEEALKFGVQVRLTKSKAEAEKYFTIRRHSFDLLHSHSTDKETAPFIDDFIVKPEYLPEFLPKLNRILEPYGNKLTYTIAGHPGSGNFHIIPLMNLKDEASRAIIPKLSEEVYNLVLEYRGSITAEHNDGLIRGPYLKKMYGDKVYALFEEVKNIFDPDNIFNPNKKIGVSLEYALSKIKKD